MGKVCCNILCPSTQRLPNLGAHSADCRTSACLFVQASSASDGEHKDACILSDVAVPWPLASCQGLDVGSILSRVNSDTMHHRRNQQLTSSRRFLTTQSKENKKAKREERRKQRSTTRRSQQI